VIVLDLVAIATAFLLGLFARLFGLPPLVGYLIAGFVLYASGMRITDTLREFSEMGVTLLLFSIGLKLRLRSLVMPQIWTVASLHMLITVALFVVAISLLGGIGLPLLAGLDFDVALIIAFALSFSSTVFAVKVLEEKGETSALYGRVAIGILIMQDIAAVVFMAVSMGKIPSPWALFLLGLVPLRPVLFRLMERAGHGELLVLFGISLALGGAILFEFAGVKGDLGALILGLLLSRHRDAAELSKHLLGFKDLFLVGFFLAIGLSGPLDLAALWIAVLLVVMLPIKALLFHWLLTLFHLRARTSLLASISLANYSEFGLIVGGVAVAGGWISNQWLIVIAIALSISFILAAPLNTFSHQLYKRFGRYLQRYESVTRIAEEEPIRPGSASVLIFGMGRVGTGAYDSIHDQLGADVVGIDLDPETVQKHDAEGRNVLRGSGSDPEFWTRFRHDFEQVRLVLLAMPNCLENCYVTRQIRELGYQGRLAAVARYEDEIAPLKDAGVDAVFNLYATAGAGLAEDACRDLCERSKSHV
jgi:predicted Kef-type K+ transport protein